MRRPRLPCQTPACSRRGVLETPTAGGRLDLHAATTLRGSGIAGAILPDSAAGVAGTRRRARCGRGRCRRRGTRLRAPRGVDVLLVGACVAEAGEVRWGSCRRRGTRLRAPPRVDVLLAGACVAAEAGEGRADPVGGASQPPYAHRGWPLFSRAPARRTRASGGRIPRGGPAGPPTPPGGWLLASATPAPPPGRGPPPAADSDPLSGVSVYLPGIAPPHPSGSPSDPPRLTEDRTP